MHITKLSYVNFKGHNGAFDLAPVTVITGANFGHKTTIPLAIRLALAGYLPPPIGTRGIYDLAGNPEGAGQMAIGLVTDTKREITWTWTKDAAGKVKTSGAATPDIKMPELMLEPGLFFGKTAAERTQIVFSVCDVESFTPSQIKDRLSEVIVPPVMHLEGAIRDITDWMDKNPLRVPMTPQLWVSNLTDWLKIQQKFAKEDAGRLSNSFEAFKGQAIRKDVTGPLKAAKEKLAEMHRQSGAGCEALLLRQSQIVKELAKLETSEDLVVRLAKLEAVLKEKDPGEHDPDEWKDELALAVARHKRALDSATAEAARLKSHIESLASLESCPTCLNSKKGWKVAAEKALAEQLGKAIAARDSANGQWQKSAEEFNRLKDWISAWDKREALTRAREERTNLEAELDQITKEVATKQAGVADLSNEIAQVQVEISALEEEQRAWDLYMTQRAKRDELEQALLRAQCRQEVFKAVVTIVQEESSKLISEAFKGVLHVARHFTDGLLNSPLEFVDGELGRRVSKADRASGIIAPEGAWIPFDAFSGTENLLALAGFGVALTDGAPIKLVVLDELGRLDEKRKLDVTLRMLSLVDSGVIDQSILVDVDPKPYRGLVARQNFKLIHLSQ